ncbi:hypothetical protein ABKV19_025235 [Rosa sericea]
MRVTSEPIVIYTNSGETICWSEQAMGAIEWGVDEEFADSDVRLGLPCMEAAAEHFQIPSRQYLRLFLTS